MQQLFPATYPGYGVGYLMPVPSPLGRLVRRRRGELGLTQPQLANLVGHGIKQNTISRLESGKTQAINNPEQLQALAQTLGYESDEDFIMAAYAPHVVREHRVQHDTGPEWEIGEGGELIRIIFPSLSPERRRQLSDYAKWLREQEGEQERVS